MKRDPPTASRDIEVVRKSSAKYDILFNNSNNKYALHS